MIILFILIFSAILYYIIIGIFSKDIININFSNSDNSKTYNILSKNALNTGESLLQYLYSFRDVKCSFKFDENLNFIPSYIKIIQNNTKYKIKIYYIGYIDNPSNCLQKYILIPEEKYNNINIFLDNNQNNYIGLIISLEK